MSKGNIPTTSLDLQSIIATQFHGESSLDTVVESLPEFTEGTPENPGKGYQVLTENDSNLLSRIVRKPIQSTLEAGFAKNGFFLYAAKEVKGDAKLN